MADLARINRVLDRITDENLNMSRWGKRTECGTTFCFAGHTLDEAGISLVWWPNQEAVWHFGVPSMVVEGECAVGIEGGGEFEETAARLLGLTDSQANRIFFATQVKTVAELRGLIEWVLSGDLDECTCSMCQEQ